MPVVNRNLRSPNRRDFLRAGSLTAFGLSLADLFRSRSRADASSRPPAKSCILVWLDGGPSHVDTFDLKPDAPAEVRGPFRPIATATPGVSICELLPRTARLSPHFAIVRSLTSPLGEHNLGAHYLLTGYKPSPVLSHPVFGSVVAHVRRETAVLPPFVAVPDHHTGGGRTAAHGFLHATTGPFEVGRPQGSTFRVPHLDYYAGLNAERLQNRRNYLMALDRLSSQIDARTDGNGEVAPDPVTEQAYRLITSREAKQAFELSDEPNAVRQRYGSRPIGPSCLLARRLVERGVRFVTVNNTGWDTHQQLITSLKDGFTGATDPVGLIPSLDLALSALLSDLHDRGMLDETLVVVMGEFGRTPRVNTTGGRDHWPRVFSVLLAGGGIRGGQVIGASDALGESPHERPVTPADLAATIYGRLGIDPAHLLYTSDGRPVRISHEGTSISELL